MSLLALASPWTGSGSIDSDGTIATYAWVQTAGDTVSLSPMLVRVTPDFTAPSTAASQTLTFRLTVTDNDGDTDTDTVNVVVAAAFTVPAFSDDIGDAQDWTQDQAITSITVPQAAGNPTPTYAAVGSLPIAASLSIHWGSCYLAELRRILSLEPSALERPTPKVVTIGRWRTTLPLAPRPQALLSP